MEYASLPNIFNLVTSILPPVSFNQVIVRSFRSFRLCFAASLRSPPPSTPLSSLSMTRHLNRLPLVEFHRCSKKLHLSRYGEKRHRQSSSICLVTYGQHPRFGHQNWRSIHQHRRQLTKECILTPLPDLWQHTR